MNLIYIYFISCTATITKNAFSDHHGIQALIKKCLQYRNLTAIDDEQVASGMQDFFKRAKERLPKDLK